MGWILHPNHTAQYNSQSQINILSESSWTADLIEALSDLVSVNVRDTCTSKYLLANNRTAKLYGVESVNNLIGISFHEFWIEDIHHRKNKLHLSNPVLHWEEQELKRVEQYEEKVCATKRPLTLSRVAVRHDNSILCERLTKLPILDRYNKKVVASITFIQDLTSQFNLFDLLQLYRQHYPDIQAIQLVLKYLKIDSRFSKLPTIREVQILLALHHQINRKKVSRILNISANTLASHLQHLKEKLIVPDLNEVLMQLCKAPLDKGPFNPLCAPAENASA